MRIRACFVYLLFVFVSFFSFAQQPDASHETPDAVNTDSARARDGGAVVPHFMRYSGLVKDDAGTPRTGVVGLTFALYDQVDGGAAIWQETQNVTLDDSGRYNVLLGATKSRGLPMEPFASGDARFIGVRVVEEGAAEQARVRLVSVPYALAAGDAQSLGGRPVTDFALTKAAAVASGDASQAAPGTDPMVTSGTAGFIGKFTNATDLGNSTMSESGNGLVSVTGGFALPSTTNSTTGVVSISGSVFMHAYGGNTFLGLGAGNFTMSGLFNTGIGDTVLHSNTTGTQNTAVGHYALLSNTTGVQNTAHGYFALTTNTIGTYNTATGFAALETNTSGSYNTASGTGALLSNTTGINNTAVGYQAGYTATPANANVSGSNNTFIGYNSGPGTSTQLTNASAIGSGALVSQSNSMVLGNGSVNVGIGTSTPTDTLHVNGGIRFGAGTFVPGQAKLFTSAQHGTLLTANTGSSNDIALVSASGNLLLTNPTGTNNLVMLSGGGFGVNTSVITEKLTVNGGIQFGPSSFSAGAPTLYKDSAHGSVLTASQGSSNDLALVSRVGNLLLTNPTGTNNLVFFSGGNFGLNTFTPTTLLDVNGVVRAAGGIKFSDNSTQTTSLPSPCTINQVPKWNGTTWMCAADATSGGGGGVTVFDGSTIANSAVVTVNQHGAGITNPDPLTNLPPVAIIGSSDSNTGVTTGVSGKSTSPLGIGVLGIVTGGPTGQDENVSALVGIATSTTGRTRGVEAEVASANGVAGHFRNSNSAGSALQASVGPDNDPNVAKLEVTGSGISMSGTQVSLTGPTITLQGPTGNATVQVGGTLAVTGSMSSSSLTTSNVTTPNLTGAGGGNSVNVVGNFSVTGNASILGNLSKGGGSFKIDHPLDPAGKYLYHSFVESPDMMNVYNGNVVLDSKGEAWITMPEWFEALNMDFRYQLTPISNPGRRVLYIAKKLTGNRFKIAGGSSRGEVSWQVTGIRHDAWANAHRIPLEEVKPYSEQGTYLHPELFKDAEEHLAKK